MRFRAVLELEGKTATGIQVPGEVLVALGKCKRPPVRVTLSGHTYRTTVAAEHRRAAGLAAGDEVDQVFSCHKNDGRII